MRIYDFGPQEASIVWTNEAKYRGLWEASNKETEHAGRMIKNVEIRENNEATEFSVD